MPPKVLVQRLGDEAVARFERRAAPRRARRFGVADLIRQTGSSDLAGLWDALATRPYPAVTAPDEAAATCAGDRDRVVLAAEDVLSRRIELLGSGPFDVGRPVRWQRDPKTGHEWPVDPSWRIDYADLGRPTDVKLPWEISRLQWALPAGQAYLLTGDERYARAVRDVLDEWIEANPYGLGVNWCIAMEPALRIVAWTWLFHVFHASDAWRDGGFRARFLVALYLHADFVERHLERAAVNGNHFTANATGLVFAGSFFGSGARPNRWAERGWDFLVEELPRQVTPDGVDFEASTAYHRLVCELFLLPALYRERLGRPVPDEYRIRLAAMAKFAAAYTRPDGTSPLWGDADDARALPLGNQPRSDHRYLADLIGLAWQIEDLIDASSDSQSEVRWLLGEAAERLSRSGHPSASAAFPDGGVYIMRTELDHVFIDCGPVGLAGRGGHGHNDCLSFEAALDGVRVITDSGSYVYTASPAERERFRSTEAHSTPVVDDTDQNRAASPPSLWHLSYDARPRVLEWHTSGAVDRLSGEHAGYERLDSPVTPVRTFELDRARHALTVRDEFRASAPHRIRVPYHLHPELTVEAVDQGRFRLTSGRRSFLFDWSGAGWQARLRACWVSPSYGVKVRAVCIELFSEAVPEPLTVAIAPA